MKAAPRDWRNARATPLTGGLTNKVWRLDREESSAVLKIDAEPRRAPFRSRQYEARVQRLAAEIGLAGRVLHVDETTLLTEFVEGRGWSEEDCQSDAQLSRLAQSLKRLHALPPTGEEFDATGAARLYVEQIDASLSADAEYCLSVILDTPTSRQVSLCHNDLVRENILLTPDLRLLDWEYACDNSPLFDLATIVEHHHLDERQVAVLMSAYFGNEADAYADELAQQRRVCLALWWLYRAAHNLPTISELP